MTEPVTRIIELDVKDMVQISSALKCVIASRKRARDESTDSCYYQMWDDMLKEIEGVSKRFDIAWIAGKISAV